MGRACVSVVLACSYRVNINILVGGEGGGMHMTVTRWEEAGRAESL